jgi:hypothetical protein
MTKKALCVGINDYPFADNDLKGCVNDARAWAKLLTDHFDFPAENVRLIEDADATRANLLGALDALVSGSQPGDILVFTNSSHGSYVADENTDEPKYDEILCPYDIADSVIADDELRARFSAIPDGVQLTAILDNCFSGTGTRAPIGFHTPDDRRRRFFSPALRGDPVLDDPWEAKSKRKEKFPQSGMKEVLLSGCTDKQYSYDAKIDGVYHGAMTYHAIKAIQDANYALTYAQLYRALLDLLAETNYDQEPQLAGRDENMNRMIFS